LPLYSPRSWSIITCSLALLGSLVLAAGCDSGPKFKSTDITGADYGKSLDLADHNGKPRHLEDFRGKAVVVFFGFTHCPDVCPTTLAEMAQVVKSLGPDGDRVQVVLVTVDPERDTRDALAKYVTAFDPRFLGMSGDLEATRRVAKDFKIYFEKRKTGDTYSVDHSAQSYVIDPQGRLRLFVRHDRISADLADDLRVLLKETS
jgi:protein SCO1/2